MGKLAELLELHCPNGVEFKRIGEVCHILDAQRKPISKSKRIKGSYPYYGANGIQDYVSDYIFDGTFLLVGEDGSVINKDNSPVLNWAVGKIWVNNHAHILTARDSNNLRYIYYALQIQDVSKIVRGVPPKINQENLKSIRIPLPHPEVQEEIVKILDRFAEYAAELQAELQARQEQYEYYRNKLLTFSEIGGGIQSVIWMKMSEVGTFIRGKRFVRTDIVNDGVPCIHYGDMYTYYGLYATKSKGMLKSELAPKMRYAQKNDVVIVAAGENKEDIGIGMAWLGDEPAAVHDACFIFKSDLYPQYVSHYLRTNYYHKQIVKHVSEGKICSISAKGLGNAIIPIPSYEEQVRIATLLNKFDELVSDLVQGLPAEIVAVKEQYEYYRNKLLSFPEYKLRA